MKEEREKAVEHIASLKIQGKTFNTVNDAFEGKLISKWSEMTQNILPSTFFTFVRKTFQQQLATAANIFRWKKTDSDKCPLCGCRQTNKHTVLYCIVSIHLYSASCSAHQSEALPVREPKREEI